MTSPLVAALKWLVLGVSTLAAVLGSACNGNAPSEEGGAPGSPSTTPGGPEGPAAPPPVTEPPQPVQPPAVSCARKDVAHGAPVALFDAFTGEMKTLTGAARATRVDKLLADVAAQGGSPLEDATGGRVVFLARSVKASKVAGSFVGWDASKGIAFTTIADTDLRVAETSIPHGTSFEYKLLTGSPGQETFVEDPLAKTVVWDGIDRGFQAPGEMNGVGHPGDAPMDRGRMISLGKVHATKLADDRDVWVHYPAAYDADAKCEKKLPSIVFHDGRESLTRGGFAKEADALYAAHPELAAVLVFVGLPTQQVRMAQYTFASEGAKGADYVDFLKSDLWPIVTKEATRVCSKAAARGVAGASLGGLISTYSAFEHPDQWGWVGSQSGSYFWANDAMITRASTEAKKPVRIYLDSGCPDDNCVSNDQLAQALQEKGYDFVRIKKAGDAHDWSFWRERLGGMLTHFRDKQTVCD